MSEQTADGLARVQRRASGEEGIMELRIASTGAARKALMRIPARRIAMVVLAMTTGCASVGRVGAATRESSPLRGFAHLASGDWTTTLASGDVLRETWRWEPDGRSLRVLGLGSETNSTPWREEQVFFVDERSGEVRVEGSNSYRAGTFKGTVTFGDHTAEAQFILTQDGATRSLVRRWRFEGDDRFETELLEVIFGEGLVPLTSWTYTRTSAAKAEPPALTPGR
jgi:hypothetical protein